MKRRVLRISPRADAEVDDITRFIATGSAEAAERWIEAYVETIYSLTRYPYLGSLAPQDPDQLLRRVLVNGFRKYGVYYHVTDKAIIIQRVLHGARDIASLLRDSGRFGAEDE